MGDVVFDPPGDGLSAAVERRLGHGSGPWQSLLEEIMAALDATAAAITCYHWGVECTGPVRQTLICQRGTGRTGSADGASTLRSEAVSLRELGREGREEPRVRVGPVWTSHVPAQDFCHCLCAVLVVEEDHITVLELGRALDRAPFGTAEVEGLERLLPGLQLAVRCLLRSAAGDVQARVFNRLPIAVAEIGANREILFQNYPLQRLLSKADGLQAVSDRVRADAVRDDHALAEGVRRASVGIRPPGLLHIGRPSGRQPYLVHIEPFMHRTPRVRAYTGTVMLVVLSPTDCDRDTIVWFGMGFGLTRAEIRIVQLLLEGRGVQDIAGCLEGSAHTVRWHLKSIYAKTGTAGQADVVRLFMHAMHLSIACRRGAARPQQWCSEPGPPAPPTRSLDPTHVGGTVTTHMGGDGVTQLS